MMQENIATGLRVYDEVRLDIRELHALGTYLSIVVGKGLYSGDSTPREVFSDVLSGCRVHIGPKPSNYRRLGLLVTRKVLCISEHIDGAQGVDYALCITVYVASPSHEIKAQTNTPDAMKQARFPSKVPAAQ